MNKNYLTVFLIMLIFFVISFLTNIMGPIIPDIIRTFDLSLTLVSVLPFSFFIAYGIMSIPSGILLEKFGEKKLLTASFLIASCGAFLFAFIPDYKIAIVSLFLIGSGMAVLQVVINPLLRQAGGESHFAFNSVLAQLVFGLASFLSPQIYSYLVLNLENRNHGDMIILMLSHITPEKLPWISLYWLFLLISLLMLFIISIYRFPRVELKENERIGSLRITRLLLNRPVVVFYFLGIFAYVGTEQGIANWISQFLLTYHNFDPQTTGADTVSLFWGFMTLGCLLGLILLKFLDSRLVLKLFTMATIICLSSALYGSGEIALVAFPATGFFASVMWSIIFSLALNSIDKFHGSFSGILVTGIIGGALVPLIIGSISEALGLRNGMLLLFVTLGYIGSIGFWSKPLIKNATIKITKNKLK